MCYFEILPAKGNGNKCACKSVIGPPTRLLVSRHSR